ncbi:MAG: hypothetical protein M3Y65_22955 [Pseudomonadota bacterium]|nr:hypothetical protein [Pseudomonadota bacterium]
MKQQLRYLALYCLFIVLACFSIAASATIVNQASVTYADPKNGNVNKPSNEVRTVLQETISYYTSASFDREARVTASGTRLYVQASAPACDIKPDTIEKIVIRMTSTRLASSRDFTAIETAPDSGIFRIESDAIANSSEGAKSALAAATKAAGKTDDEGNTVIGVNAGSDNALYVADNDTLTATIMGCGTGRTQTSILIDPAGVVFDSKTGVVLAGARVSLIDVTGAGNGGTPGGAARVFDFDGVTALPSTVVTGADGMYQFPLVSASVYRLAVIPPKNYLFPSKIAAGKLAGGHTINPSGSYGAEFVVSALTGAVVVDLPVDTTPGLIYIEKLASRATAEVGDFVDYTVKVHNAVEMALTGVSVDDNLPAGFSLAPGTVRVDGVKVPDPTGARGPGLRFDVGTVPATGSVTLQYRARIGAGALQGDGINRASATSTAPLILSSVEAAARVKVTPGVFSAKGYIVGQVYADCDANGLRDATEPGIPGVRIYLEDGSFSITDADGRYSFADLRARTHIAKLDTITLPQGAALAILDLRNSGDAGSRFVDLKNGELAKADFAVSTCNPELRAAIAARRNAVKESERKAAATIAAAAAPVAVKAAAVSLDTLDNTLGFVDLVDGVVLPSASSTVRVKGGAGATFALKVNGATASEKIIGQRSTNAAHQLEVWEFVGVALQPGVNVLEVAQVDSFGNPRGSRSVKVVVPGKLAKIHLTLDKPGVSADGKSLASLHVRLEDADGVAVTERTGLTLDTNGGEWQQKDIDPRTPGLQLFVEGGAIDVTLRAPMAPVEARIKAFSGTVEAATRVDFVPDLRPLVGAGVFDGAISLKSISGNVSAPKRDFDGFEDQLRHFSGNGAGGSVNGEIGTRAAGFAKGKVGDNTLLTMSYDSDKATDTPLFRDLDPAAYYPTYGDGSQRGFDAQSTGRLYLRADREKSWLLYGDFTPPGVTPARNLGAYNRVLNGLRHHYEKDGLTVDSFASHDSTRQVVTEIAANGTSGPYLMGAGTMVINSERIEIIVRSRNQRGIILSNVSQVRYADYDIEPLTGRILFRAPVASLDADLNPVSIRISYEVDQGSPQFWVAGSAAQYKVTDMIDVGGSYVDDKNPVAATTMMSANVTVKPDASTVIIAEVAKMDKMDLEGRAARIDATRKDGKLDTHVYAGRAGVNFDNPSASLPKGRAEAGINTVYRVNEQISFGGELIHTADLLTGASRDGLQLNAGYAFGSGLRAEIGVRHAQETPADAVGNNQTVTQPDLTSVRAKVSAQVPGLPQASVFAEAEQDVRDSSRRMVALGGDYRMAGGSRLYGRHELISSLGSNYALNDGQQRNATVFGIDSDYMKDGRVFSEYRARGAALDGRQAEAAVGLRNLFTVADGVRVNTSLERVKVMAGSNANEAIAVTGAIEYNRTPEFKANTRLELRHAVDSDNVLSTVGLAYRLSDTWSLLGKNTLAAIQSRASNSTRLTDLLQSGVAFRALETLGWNGLAKYEYKVEQDNGFADLKRAVHSVAVSANWQPTRESVFTARYAAKIARDRSAGLDTRSSAQLIGARMAHDIGKDWNVGVIGQMLVEGGTRARQFGAGIEAGYQVRKNTWVSAGYNFLGFKEPDLSNADATSRGIYVRLRMKFDEHSLTDLLSAPAL